ncbi:MAG: hypothetical protein JXA93_19335 [Anaerolineae bacterium]|nr:hypothetical protein [Anaerolineae bacterium]
MSPGLYRNDSFIVRIWWERGPGPQAIWRGQVVHARTGQSTYFENLPTLLQFVQGWTGSLAEGSGEWNGEEGPMGNKV